MPHVFVLMSFCNVLMASMFVHVHVDCHDCALFETISELVLIALVAM